MVRTTECQTTRTPALVGSRNFIVFANVWMLCDPPLKIGLAEEEEKKRKKKSVFADGALSGSSTFHNWNLRHTMQMHVTNVKFIKYTKHLTEQHYNHFPNHRRRNKNPFLCKCDWSGKKWMKKMKRKIGFQGASISCLDTADGELRTVE